MPSLVITLTSVTAMGKTNNTEFLNGLFEGGNFPNAQIIVMTGDGIHVSYEACKKKDENETEITLTKEMLYQVVPRIQHFFRGSSSYAVLFCVGRDEFNYPDNMSQFEREMGDCPEPQQLDYLCPAGTLASAFYHNSYLKLPVKTWKDNGVKDKVLLLADEFRTAVKELNLKKESDTEK